MNRKKFLYAVSGAALSPLVPKIPAVREAAAAETPPAANCHFTPSVPEGPFYFDPKLVRREIAEGRPGVPIEYRLAVVDAQCRPVANARIDVWQCDNEGVYSGYDGQSTGASTVGKTFLRGTQLTDTRGNASFAAIYPGWYPRRLTHLHVKIFLSAKAVVTTNLFFPDKVNSAVYASPLYKSRGSNSATVAQDVELKGDEARFKTLMLSLDGNENRGYVGTYTFGIAT